jgi:hypothetical protein
MRRLTLLAAALLCSAFTASVTHAQAAVAANAMVAVAAPTGNGIRNLTFGDITITPGATQNVSVPAAVNAQSATVASGEFLFDVSSTRGVDFQLSLPTTLNSGGTAAPLAISFNGAQYVAHCVTSGGSACTLTTFNPAATPVITVCSAYKGNGDCKNNSVFGGGSELRLYLGGMITVPPTQAAATYTATVTLLITQVY